jgi:hypothetical protein
MFLSHALICLRGREADTNEHANTRQEHTTPNEHRAIGTTGLISRQAARDRVQAGDLERMRGSHALRLITGVTRLNPS